ncbi:zinc-binding dehydrogenase [Halodesulfurarchaeum formicicum]|uniref:Zinc-binding dehydrogenase n=2 Tax=Halodesulfurarchaeum formicicum TaxID=1873524 RepID=A0A1J1AB01_9EURY|nr:zinc-binding dehydrogenase [Halodesulfurarchaeum formicicum]
MDWGMRAVRYHEYGDPSVLAVETVDRPEPRGDELLIEVAAAAVNPVDTYFRTGTYTPAGLPMIPGADVAGTVAAVGPDVSKFEPGDRVFGTGLGRDRQGTYAEFAVGPETHFAALPAGIDFDSGAAIALVGVTAWRALVHHAGLEPAETCLIHGGGGGVGHVAVQLAAATGAEVIATGRPAIHDELSALGADHTLDYARDDLADAVIEAGRPAVILDHRLDEYLQFDAEVARVGTRVVGIGNTEPEAGFGNVAAARATDLELVLMSMFNTPRFGPVLDRLGTLMQAGEIRPRIARTYDLSDAATAQRAVLSDQFLGKLVVEP